MGTLVGCAGTMTFIKPGQEFTHQDVQKDFTECQVMANQAGYGTGSIIANMHHKRFLETCMNGRGWARTD